MLQSLYSMRNVLKFLIDLPDEIVLSIFEQCSTYTDFTNLGTCSKNLCQMGLSIQKKMIRLLHMPWRKDIVYNLGERVHYSGNNYECVLTHYANWMWRPDIAIGVWMRLL